MRKTITALLLISALALVNIAAHARGGTDCPPGSTDPDCQTAAGGGR